MRSNIQFHTAQFITKNYPYKESAQFPTEWIAVDKMVKLGNVFFPDKPIPNDANLRLYQSRVVISKIGRPPEKALLKCRGVVSYEFSRKCRRRLMNAFHSWQVPDNYKRYHIILTYPASYPDDWHVWKDHLKAFKRKLQAVFGDSIEGYWRLELQKRGAPHYHLLVALPKGMVTNKRLYKLITQWWASIAHTSDQYQGKYATKIKVIHNDAMAQSYVSKYCAKVSRKEKPMEARENISLGDAFEQNSVQFRESQLAQKSIGRQWGRIGAPNEEPLFELNLSLEGQHLLKSVIIPILASWGSSFGAKLLHKPDTISWQVYGIKGYALAYVWDDLFPERDKHPDFNPFT